MIANINYLFRVIYIATQRFFMEKYTYQVSALAFTTILSLIPIFSISIFASTIFPEFSNLVAITENYIFTNFVPTAAYAMQVYFQNFIQQAIHLPIVSILFLIVTSLLMINTIDETINDIWHLPKRRIGILIILFYAVILLIAPVLLGLSIFLTSYLFSLSFFTIISPILVFILPLFINTIIFSLCFIFFPNTDVKKIHAIFGGFMAALLLQVARTLFAFYISIFSNYELIYGVFSMLPIFLIWLYICWFIILWAAVFTYTLSHTQL